jgi:malate synthase
MAGPNQLHVLREDVVVTEAQLLAVPEGPRTLAALRTNVNVSIGYLAAWLGGLGCVPLHNLMEDAATAEISRTQVWQWVRHGAVLDDGQRLTLDRVALVVLEELDAARRAVGSAAFAAGRWLEAGALFKRLVAARELPDFLTLEAYEQVLEAEFAPGGAGYRGGGGGGSGGARAKM